MEPLSLLELNSLVRDTLTLQMPQRYWLAAELSECSVKGNGHCYLDFVQKSETTSVVLAKAPGHIWRSIYPALSMQFERETGQVLTAGLKVLVEVEVAFHEVYGYSLNVTGIDPTYTLGDQARQRREILQRLKAEGVIDMNKELHLPRPLRRIAVISNASAAGFGDFCNQLQNSGHRFAVGLFEAVMQGPQVEPTVISALERIAAEESCWDCVVIIRGGGAAADLLGFESYALADTVAEFPLPVLTGIGHERDETVIDLVANTRLKTPTAVAAFLIDRQQAETALIANLEDRLRSAAKNRLRTERLQFESTARRLQTATAYFGSRQRERLLNFASRIKVVSSAYLHQRKQFLDSVPQRSERAVRRRIATERRRLEALGKSVVLSGPERILKLGFSITSLNGRALTDASVLREGDIITTRFANGTAQSTVNKTNQHE